MKNRHAMNDTQIQVKRADSIEGLNQSHDLALKPSAEASY
ncbi:Uncharacterized protein BM_BM17947 [Brugia malayi]|uniref:Uncharacterized protein n=1 Tax=Brugia malayi TaxID=6279 RepID=A0A4E9ET46_BRUMA|nr:Uncharacterized protein BM_BM17947 [Brugia malayi]VIO87376.1 Uncharacterized protein BM_BM17947 [Brugia malayi]